MRRIIVLWRPGTEEGKGGGKQGGEGRRGEECEKNWPLGYYIRFFFFLVFFL